MAADMRINPPYPLALRLATVGLALACGALSLCMPVATASAHVPALEPAGVAAPDAARPIGGPEVSRAIYGYLAPGETADTFAFTVSEPVTRTIGLIVPAYPEHADFRPTLVVRAEGQPDVTIVDPGTVPRAASFEPFSLTSFWSGAESEIGFTPGTRYLLSVEPGAGSQSGRYVIVFGGPEQFDSADTAETFAVLPRIWFGAYGGAPVHLGSIAVVPLVLVVGALVAFAVFRVRRRWSE